MPPKKAATKAKRTMSDDHKAAIASGRKEAKAISDYLEALTANKPKRGRKRSPATIEKRLAQIEEELPAADGLATVNLRQERLDLQAELAALTTPVDLGPLEDAFVEHAGAYSRRKGITYAVWRESGVPPKVLQRAGVTRGS